jgi:cell wall assembly regulator SMI1
VTVAYIDARATASPELIDRLEQQVGQRLPDDYRDHLLRQDGGSLEFNSEGVQNIFGLGELPEYQSTWENLQVYHDRVPPWLLPVASSFA